MTTTETYNENSRRLRDFFRNYSMALYNAAIALPEPPLLLEADGSERLYQLPARTPQGVRAWIKGSQVGPGPDRWGYYSVVLPLVHQVGDLWNDAEKGGVWCLVETPLPSGTMEPKWLRIV